MIGDAARVDFLQRVAFLAFSLSQPVNAVAPCHLRDPRAEGQGFVSLVQHPVQLQKDLRRGILGVLRPPKKPPADPQNVLIMGRVD